jgi:hypothetical protein
LAHDATITTPVSFNEITVVGGSHPLEADAVAGLIIDTDGELFGTTSVGDPGLSANDYGAMVEIKKAAAGYASTPTTLASFDGEEGGITPVAGLIADTNGDLFGTTRGGGADARCGGQPSGVVFSALHFAV